MIGLKLSATGKYDDGYDVLSNRTINIAPTKFELLFDSFAECTDIF